MNLGRHVGGLAGRLLRPPGWPLYTLTAIAALISIWAAAAPMPSGQIALLLEGVVEEASWTSWRHALSQIELTEVRCAYATIAWGAVAAVWIARRLARGVVVRRIAPGQRAAPFAYWRRWLTPPVALLIVCLFCLTPAPVYVGFWVSKPFINAAGRNWTGNPTAPPRGGIRWVGIYPVDRDRGLWSAPAYGSGLNMVNASDFGGFVHSPSGPPGGLRGYDLRYVGGGWYTFTRADAYR
jgi:hypothetical protein